MIDKIISLSRTSKQVIMLLFDSVLLVSALLASFSIRLGYWFWPNSDLLVVVLGAPVIAIPIFIKFGLYHDVVRYLGLRTLWATTKAVSLYALIWGVIGFMAAVQGIPRSVILINWVVLVLVIGGSRLFARWLLSKSSAYYKDYKSNVIIYGAGSAGRQLSDALVQSKEYRPIAFIDDAVDIQRQLINGIEVHGFDNIESLIRRYEVKELLLAMPSTSRKRRNEIVNSIEPLSIQVRTLPGVSDIAKGRVMINDLHEISIEDLLGRDSVEANQSLLDKNIKDKVIMVTGAGGSIGSELCRQIIKLGANKIILLDQSELALYLINKEFSNLEVNTYVLPILGSVTNQDRIERICTKFNVQTIYHTAAYKHVPMVELNDTEGAKNNIFGTLSCAQAAINCNVETFVLISTDKAVRPTNTMGASKRIAELVLQALSEKQHDTKFCAVRFGNVLGSSGSVIPLFKEQIKHGGPVTVTDIDIIRYFMTIPESVELVIQAGAMGDKGDVFVLNMGPPILINELARKMIHLSGLQVKDSNNPEGDIEIEYTGLRSGEKLYEELLIGESSSATENPMIMRAQEYMLSWDELTPILEELETAIDRNDNNKLRELLIKAVPGFVPQSDITDILCN